MAYHATVLNTCNSRANDSRANDQLYITHWKKFRKFAAGCLQTNKPSVNQSLTMFMRVPLLT